MGDNAEPTVVTRPEAGGVDLKRTPEDLAALQGLGESQVSTEGLAARAAQSAQARRREAFDTTADKALTFAEGVIDAASLGFLHFTGDAADIRRDVNSKYATAGQLVGFAAGMEAGPVKALAGMGKKAGEKAARAVLGEVAEGSRAAVGVKTVGGAGEMAAVMGSTAIGHQVTDALLDDKPFSAHAVVHEAGLGAVLGGGFSFLSGVFSKAAKRYEIAGQGGLLDAESEVSKGLGDHVSSARKAWDDALDIHESRLGVLKQLEVDGALDNAVPQFIGEREIAVAKAKGARSVLEGLDFDAAMAGEPKAMKRYVRALEDYEQSIGQLDDLMRARQYERVRPQQPGRPIQDPGSPVTQNVGLPMDEVARMDDLMRDPARAAEYEAIHGRPYAPQAQRAASEAPMPGGQVSPTSELKTPVAKGIPRGVAETPGEPPGVGPWQPSAPPGRFNPAEWTPARVVGEQGEGRLLAPTTPAKDLNNVLSNVHEGLAKDQLLLPDGYFIPAADARQNAAAFENFRQRMATDTPMGRPTPMQSAAPAPAGEGATPVIRRGTPEPSIRPETPTGPASAPSETAAPREMTEGQRAVRRYLDEWYAASDAMGPKLSPGDAAADHIRRVLSNIQATTAGREASAGMTDMGKALGLEARTSLGATLNDIYSMRRLADVGADASKGTVMRGQRGNRFVNWVARRSAGKIGASLLGGAIGSKIGGPVGYFAGAALAYKYVGFAGRASGAAGRLYQKTIKAADGLLSGKGASYAARAAAGNRPIAYSDRGPIKDPVERIEDLRRVASSPATMADFVARASGDLNLVSPEFVAASVQSVQAQLGFLLSKAPPLKYDRLGRAMQPSAGALRRFLEAENAVFDLDGVLKAVQTGRVTQVQVEALQMAHTPVYTKLATYLLNDPVTLEKLDRAKLHTIQMVTGMPLTPSSDPAAVMRSQIVWEAARQMQPQQGATQALKIPGAGRAPSDIPSSTSTPAQSYTGRAPGN